MKSCSFFGHRDIVVTKDLQEKLKGEIENLIVNKQYTTFYFGEFGDFDFLCYNVVTQLKTLYPQIERVYVSTDERALSKHKKLKTKIYERQITFSLNFTWWYQIIYYRNIAIIDNSDYVIFYVKKTQNSGANKALKYAIKTKKEYFNIASLI